VQHVRMMHSTKLYVAATRGSEFQMIVCMGKIVSSNKATDTEAATIVGASFRLFEHDSATLMAAVPHQLQ